MLLSILIPTFNRPAKLAACLRALAPQTLPPSEYEVLIGLDGPDDVSVTAARDAWGNSKARLEIVPCPRAGLNATRNTALTHARGRYLVSLNDDILPIPTFLEAHAKAQEEGEKYAMRTARAAAAAIERRGERGR